MIRIKLVGASLSIISLVAIALTTYSLFAPLDVSIQIIKITNWLVVVALSIILGWIGVIMLRAEEPKSAEELREELRKEIEEMKKDIERAMKEQA
ncbi:hypothetical protein EYM_04920 [Ignicoccus islandicus DSM 13165]|uniref:Uncharacterized protein n=1 Tax=Ignicoccus islandicus DSM 13165 TaxID=940295 RepID=A0A0U3EDM2_9CREN|nr:hypothetical protein [Ignicoccus islandicus]ALU12531.1 hypothetical protein EYM_04920 [Ignicoccus islandicus DSM 13165]